MTPKGANLQATDLLEISELSGTGYITKSITGQEIINAGGGGGSQNLQQVTDIGQTSTNGIAIIDGDPIYDDFTFVGFNYIEMQKQSTGETLYLTTDTIEIIKSGGANGRLKVSNVTNNVTLEFPDKPTGSYTIATTADIPSGSGTVTSVDLTMPSAFTVTGNPITTSGTLAVAGAGVATQYIRGDGQLANFPTSSGGGASVSYYLNGSVSQGTFGGVAMKEINKTPVIGAGTDFTIATNGYIQSFITDANDPNQLEIPGGNWNFETYFSASSSGGTPSFYIELYKWDGATLTLIASNSANPEGITNGTVTDLYVSALAVPQTTLALTDRLAVRIYVNNSGRTITLHTENSHLCQVITTFSTGLTALNGLTAQVQNLAVGTSGTDFAISSVASTHTFNLPTASATNRGALSSADWSTFNNKVPTTRTLNGFDLSVDRTFTTAVIADSVNKRYVTDANLTVLSNTSNTNTGDETQASILSKLGIFYLPFTPSSAVTGTTSETQVAVVTIPANTIRSIDNLRIYTPVVKSGTAGLCTVTYKLSTSATMPSGTTDRIAFVAGSTGSLWIGMNRNASYNGGNLIISNSTTSLISDLTTAAQAPSVIARNNAVTLYLYISITLGNAGDSAYLAGGYITNN
jgi:hypothetical protein